jgi:hypothetical protein
MPEHEPTNNGRVTNGQLKDGLDLVRAEQKAEHTKTRALVVILAVPSVAKAVPLILGVFGWHHLW